MSLINYIEPMDPGSLFIGLGSLICSLVVAYIFYRLYIKFAHYLDAVINKDIKYMIIEEKHLEKIGNKMNIDLDKEMIKRNMIQKKPKNFRRKLEDKVFKEMFGEESKKEKV